MKRNHVSDTGVAYCDVGSGHPVLLIHAFGFDAGMWQPQIEFLTAHGYRVLAPDHRGFGDSPSPTSDHSFHTSIADALSVLDHAGVESAVAAGVSMGAATSIGLAIAHPERVSGLVLADNSRPDGPERGAAAAGRIRSLGLAGLADVYEPILFSDLFRRSDPGFISMWRERLIALDPEDLATIVEPYHGRPDPGPSLESIRVPTAIVYGSDDAAIPEHRRTDYAAIHSAAQFVIEGAGHMSSLEKPDRFNEILIHVIEHAHPSGSGRRNGVTIVGDAQAPHRRSTE